MKSNRQDKKADRLQRLTFILVSRLALSAKAVCSQSLVVLRVQDHFNTWIIILREQKRCIQKNDVKKHDWTAFPVARAKTSS